MLDKNDKQKNIVGNSKKHISKNVKHTKHIFKKSDYADIVERE